jgi:tRNA pseudouridine38-40 synthase
MNRIRLILAYDGASFKGWQSQPSGNTVQDHVEKAISGIAGEALRIHGSGRTDTGVHALGQVAHFDLPEGNRMSADDWLRALNSCLPATVRILNAAMVDRNFHARFSALGKTYRYEIDRSEILHPLRCGRVWHHPDQLDLDCLRDACALYRGAHEFSAFTANRAGDSDQPNMTRVITTADVDEDSGKVVITFSGTGFFYKMVRLLVGGAVRVSEGRGTLSWIRELLEHPGGGKCQHCAPAEGLYLEKVEYQQGE